MDLPWINAARLRELITIKDAIDALEVTFGAPALPHAPPRDQHEVGPGELLVMPSWGPQGVGVKLVSVNTNNPPHGLPLINGVYMLMDPVTLVPMAVIDGAALTGIRTAAVSGLATRYLARADASELVIFGAGTQARAHIEAMVSERPIARARIVSRSNQNAEALADVARDSGVDASVAEPKAVADADLICTCTTSHTPVFDGALVAKGTHINAIGSHKDDRRELDTKTMSRGPVVVETMDVALREAGEIVMAIDDGALEKDSLIELTEVVRGRRPRRTGDEVTVFKSVGVASEDLAVARAIADRI